MKRKLSILMLLMLTASGASFAEQGPTRDQVQSAPPSSAAPPPVPRWLEEVRAQRRALQEQRQAALDARRHAIDPLGAAQQDARKERLERLRQERREIATERRLYRNSGPWLDPLFLPPPPVPSFASPGRAAVSPDAEEPGLDTRASDASRSQPPDWDNRWYYNGW